MGSQASIAGCQTSHSGTQAPLWINVIDGDSSACSCLACKNNLLRVPCLPGLEGRKAGWGSGLHPAVRLAFFSHGDQGYGSRWACSCGGCPPFSFVFHASLGVGDVAETQKKKQPRGERGIARALCEKSLAGRRTDTAVEDSIPLSPGMTSLAFCDTDRVSWVRTLSGFRDVFVARYVMDACGVMHVAAPRS